MKDPKNIAKPSKEERKVAMESHSTLEAILRNVQSTSPEIEIEKTDEKVRIPINALKLLVEILEATSQGKIVSIVPIATEMTTQAAADLLGCSRPHLVKLLEQGKIAYTKVGKHRRVKFEDVMSYKRRMKQNQKELLTRIMHADEDAGLYDS
jgi:excisionase family DNA binding protein